jgi:uncharacterized protein (DUF2236 family)
MTSSSEPKGIPMEQSAKPIAVERPSEPAVDWAFGPGSVSWTVMADPAVFIVGLLREALLLTLHPPFAAAAVDHDSFGDDPLMRFRRVAIYTYGATYGSKADAERVSAMVRRRHHQIVGYEPLTLLPYQAHSEYELALTQAMLTASFLAVYEELHGELPSAKRDQFVLEQKVPAALLGVKPDHLPSTYGELVDYVAHARSRFATGLQAREIIAPFANGDYPRGTVIGDLPRIQRRLAMWGIRAVSDMAMVTMDPEERGLIAIGRRSKLGSQAATRRALKLLSSYLTGAKGQKVFDDFVRANTAKIFRRALVEDRAPGGRTRAAKFVVPDAAAFVVAVDGLVANWPGSPQAYVLGADPAVGEPIESAMKPLRSAK